jgi:iron-sulfur cluster assembly protein
MFKLTTKEMKVTDSAVSYLKEQINGDIKAVRFMILDGKGCGGSEYDIKTITGEDISDKDDSLEVDQDLTIYIPKKDSLRFFGVEIDYITDKLGSSRISIKNPNETAQCGCGESVSF